MKNVVGLVKSSATTVSEAATKIPPARFVMAAGQMLSLRNFMEHVKPPVQIAGELAKFEIFATIVVEAAWNTALSVPNFLRQQSKD